MSEPGFGAHIALNTTVIQCLACALIAAGILDPSDFAAVYRNAAEMASSELVESELLAFAESFGRMLAPGWTPEVVAGGKDGGNTSN